MIRVLAAMCALLIGMEAAHGVEIQKNGPQVWPGKNELAVHTGFQAGLSGYTRGTGGTPGGFKLLVDYSFRVTEIAWLNFGVNLVFGGATCNSIGDCTFYNNGHTIEPSAGIKLKFTTPIPVVPYAKIDAAFVGIYNRYCSDNGFAIAGRAGGGAKYFLFPNLGVGLDMGFTAGPALLNGIANCRSGVSAHWEFYAAFDLSIGGEYIF